MNANRVEMEAKAKSEALIARILAMPHTHRVSIEYDDGRDTYTLGTRSLASAENYAAPKRAKIGRDLIDRETGKTVRILSVTIDAL